MSDPVCRVQSFSIPADYLAGPNKYYEGRKEIGIDDPVKQECILYAAKNPAPRPEQRRGAKPAPKPSRSKLQNALAYFVTGNSSASRCGDVSEQCQSIKPHFPEFINPEPAQIDDSLLSKGVLITWETPDSYLALSNCDYSTQGIYASCNFGSDNGGRLDFHPDQSGNFKIAHTLKKKLTAPVICDVFYTNPRTGKLLPENLPSDYRFKLYPPSSEDVETTKTKCDYSKTPVVSISINSKDISNALIPAGSTFRVGVAAEDCDGINNGADLVARIKPTADSEVKMNKVGKVGEQIYFYKDLVAVDNNLTMTLYVKVSDTQRDSSYVNSFPISIIPKSSSSSSCSTPYPFSTTVYGPTPLSNYDVTSNTAVTWIIHAKNCDGTTNGLSASCDFGSLGTVTANGDSNGVITISKALTKPVTGKFSCDITGSNGKTSTNEATLWPPFYKDLSPNASIQAPSSAPVNTSVSFSVPTPTSGATYSWDFNDGNSSTGTSVSHTYTQTGKYEVELTAVYSGFTSTNKVNITIY